MTDDAQGQEQSGRRSGRRRGAALAAALVLAAVGASAAASGALSEPPPVPAANEMRTEIDAMIESGMSPDDPKIQMLEDEVAELEAGATATPRREPGVDVAATLEAAEAAEAAEDAGVSTRSAGPSATPGAAGGPAAGGGQPAWESGPVQCEAVPGLLGAAEIAAALCVSVPQPDGTSRYVAVGPDGTVRSVAFGHDGDVRRLDDTAGGVPAALAPGATVTPEGDLVLTPPGGAAVTVDLR
jgi:hypothetical protein